MGELWSEFVDSWPLFGTTYVTGWLIAIVLGLCGVVVVAQRQVFLGVATAQASSLGIACALWSMQAPFLADHGDLHGLPLASGVLFAVAASLLTIRGWVHETADALGVWIFVLASSGAVLLLAHSPHGLEEVERLMFSTLIGSDAHDLWTFAALDVLAIVACVLGYRQVLLTTTDPSTARALGLRVGGIGFVVATTLGLAIGLAMHSAGTLYTFSCLALPALAAKHLCRTMRGLFVAAPVIGVTSAFVGFVLANAYDYPPGQFAAAVQAAVLLAAWVARRVRPR